MSQQVGDDEDEKKVLKKHGKWLKMKLKIS